MAKAESISEEFPKSIRDLDIWVVWAYDDEGRKRPRAPWETETCYPVPWGSETPEADRPETTFERAYKWSQFRKFEIESIAPFPSDAADPNLKLGIILPHDPPDPPIMQVDLDDVRDPDTGEINEFAQSFIDRLNAYTMVSASGTGIHLYVRARLPDGFGKFLADFDLDDPDRGGIELYDHGRFCAITGEHVSGTPLDVPERQSEIEEIIKEYEERKCDHCKEHSRARKWDDDVCPECGEEDSLVGGSASGFEDAPPIENGGSSGNSEYFDEYVWNVAKPAHASSTGEGWGGAHPKHGATSINKEDKNSSNFAINKSRNVWHCFAHDAGGGPLTLVAVMEEFLDCAHCGGSSPLDRISDEEYLDLCLTARDEYGFSGDPPYRALVGVARRKSLALADEEEGILGEACYGVAKRIYENL